MAFSAKIQINGGGTSLYNEWECVYDASTQPTYKTMYGLEVSQPEPSIVWHTPTDGAPVPVSANEQNRQIVLTMDVDGATWDEVINSLAPLKRALNGAASRAIKTTIANTSDKVRVAIKPDGATYTTYHDVIYGTVDDSGAYYKPEAMRNILARTVVFYLTTSGTGYGDPFTLSNYVPSSPHFLIDTNADGLADGWTKSGTPTLTLDTSYALIGPTSQKCVGGSAGDGFYGTSVTTTTTGIKAAYIWMLIVSGTVTVKLRNVTDAANVTTYNLTTSNIAATASRTAVGKNGNTWYRIPLSGTVATSKAIRIEMAASGGAATWYADGAYINIAGIVDPPAFSSSRTLTNNGVAHLDFWGIPGDIEPDIRLTFDLVTQTADDNIIIGKREDGAQFASKIRYLLQDTYFANGTTWATTSNYTRASTDAATSDDYYASDETALPAPNDTADTARAIGDSVFHIFAVGRGSTTSNGIYAQWSGDGATWHNTNTVLATTANTWELWDLGVLNPRGIVMQSDPLNQAATKSGSTAYSFSSFYLRVVSVAPSGTVDIDYLLLVPVDNEYLRATGPLETIAGDVKQIWYRNSYALAYVNSYEGSMWHVAPGPRMTRLIFADYGAGMAATVGQTFIITATIIPRTSHLLGTK